MNIGIQFELLGVIHIMTLETCLSASLFLDSWKPADTEGKKQYDREFLLDFQFMPACIQKPEGLPPISDVVLDKVSCMLRESSFYRELDSVISTDV